MYRVVSSLSFHRLPSSSHEDAVNLPPLPSNLSDQSLYSVSRPRYQGCHIFSNPVVSDNWSAKAHTHAHLRWISSVKANKDFSHVLYVFRALLKLCFFVCKGFGRNARPNMTLSHSFSHYCLLNCLFYINSIKKMMQSIGSVGNLKPSSLLVSFLRINAFRMPYSSVI